MKAPRILKPPKVRPAARILKPPKVRPAARVRRRQPDKVKNRVMEAALIEFATTGFEGASVRSIATSAHVSLSLLLYHFKSKDELWRTVIDDVFHNIANTLHLGDSQRQYGSASEKLRAMIARMVRLFSEYPDLHRLMTLEGHRLSDRLIYLCDTYLKKQFKMVCELILEGQREGQVVEGEPARIRFAMIAMAAVPFSVSAEYQYLTKKSPFNGKEIDATIELIDRLVFKSRT
jgi:TetR/AcrR family transcriptional regulator